MSTLLHQSENGLPSLNKSVHLSQLCSSIEQLVYIQIAVVYYQDNSFLNLFLRWIATTNFVPPNAAALHRVPVVILLNCVCLLAHVFGSTPTPASDASRGYMNGSVLIDFVGEFAYTSRLKLVGQDILLLSLHILLMIAGNLKQKASPTAPKDPPPAQDLDAEEQGVNRAEQQQEEEQQRQERGERGTRDLGDGEDGDIEMQSLLGSSHEESKNETMVPIIELNVMRELKDIIANNAAVYNRIRSGNEEAMRTFLQAVAANRNINTTTTTQPQPATNGIVNTTTTASTTTTNTVT